MKDVPEIAPEIRGLLEEIVANPRSAIRLAPRHALRTWFDSGETIRATDVSRETAVRHLVAAHREELAALLREASWISYWKAPVLSYRPVGQDGRFYEPTDREPDWRRRSEQASSARRDRSSELELLRQCLEGIKPEQGWSLAQASLGLVPNDKTRFDLAVNAQWRKPRTAIHLFNRLLGHALPASVGSLTFQSLGTQACFLGLLGDAHRFYRAAADLDAQSPYSWGCAFNLSCFLGDTERASEEARELGNIVTVGDARILELGRLLQGWRRSRNTGELTMARNVINQISDRIPKVARNLCEDFEP